MCNSFSLFFLFPLDLLELSLPWCCCSVYVGSLVMAVTVVRNGKTKLNVNSYRLESFCCVTQSIGKNCRSWLYRIMGNDMLFQILIIHPVCPCCHDALLLRVPCCTDGMPSLCQCLAGFHSLVCASQSNRPVISSNHGHPITGFVAILRLVATERSQ